VLDKLRQVIVPVVLLLGALGAVHYTVFWMASWQYAPAMYWLTVLLFGMGAFVLLACWYYLGRNRVPVLAAVIAVICVDTLSILSAGGMDLSRVSFAKGFDLEIAALTLPLGAYVAAHFVSRLARGRD
jgi:hypothetical protein